MRTLKVQLTRPTFQCITHTSSAGQAEQAAKQAPHQPVYKLAERALIASQPASQQPALLQP
jgi:hypothetical protein